MARSRMVVLVVAVLVLCLVPRVAFAAVDSDGSGAATITVDSSFVQNQTVHPDECAWEQTGGCQWNGPRESHADLACHDEVPPGRSGRCVCRGEVVFKGDCAHSAIRCSDFCKTDEVAIEVQAFPETFIPFGPMIGDAAGPQDEDGQYELKHVESHQAAMHGDPHGGMEELKFVKKTFAESSVWKELTPYNVQEHVANNRPFAIILLCECARDHQWSLPLVDQRIRDMGWETQFEYLYVFPPATAQWHLIHRWQIEQAPALIIDNIPVAGPMTEKYLYRGDLSAMTAEDHLPTAIRIVEFLQKFKLGQLDQVVMSQPEPAPAQHGKITDVVGSTFREQVMDPTKCVLLLIYSPGCPASVAVQPVFRHIAALMKDEPNFRTARIDFTVNDIPTSGINVRYYPTVYLMRNENVPERKNVVGPNDILNFANFNGMNKPHMNHRPHSHYSMDLFKSFIEDHCHHSVNASILTHHTHDH